MSKRP